MTEKGKASIDLKKTKHDLLTELTIGGLKSDEARNFLTRIPTVDQLIAPTAREALTT
jgi:hypothetical protein